MSSSLTAGPQCGKKGMVRVRKAGLWRNSCMAPRWRLSVLEVSGFGCGALLHGRAQRPVPGSSHLWRALRGR